MDMTRIPEKCQRVGSDQDRSFYGMKYAVGFSNFLCVTGGLRTNPDMQVCDEKDAPIDGLYNAGVMVGDMYANCYNFAICGHNLSSACNTFLICLQRS